MARLMPLAHDFRAIHDHGDRVEDGENSIDEDGRV